MTIVSGDINHKILKHRSLINELYNVMYSHSLQFCITEPTRIISKIRASLIGNIFINMSQNT